MRTRDELKSRAQEAVRQWRAKCRRLQKELEEARADAQLHMDKASQVSGEGTISSVATTLNKQPLKLAPRSRPIDKQTVLILTNTRPLPSTHTLMQIRHLLPGLEECSALCYCIDLEEVIFDEHPVN